jgi:hypothetical protein
VRCLEFKFQYCQKIYNERKQKTETATPDQIVFNKEELKIYFPSVQSIINSEFNYKVLNSIFSQA